MVDGPSNSAGPDPEGSGGGTPRNGSRDEHRGSFWTSPAYRFVFFFLINLGLVAVLYPYVREAFPDFFQWLMRATARVEFEILRPFSDEVRLSGSLVAYEGFVARIILECTGVYEMLIFGAAVLAFPATWTKKAIGIGLGFPLLYFFNVVRILFLIIVGAHWHSVFEFMHIYFWQATLILMITSVWLLWIFKVVRDDD